MRPSLPLTSTRSGQWKLDCLGLPCPVPVIKTGQAMREVAVGDIVTVLSDDPSVELDLRDWCSANRQVFVDVQNSSGVITTRIQRAH